MTNYPNDEDGAVLAELDQRGFDLNVPRTVEISIDVPDEIAANKVCQALQSSGFECESYYDEGEPDYVEGEDDADEFGPSWSVFVKLNQFILSYDAIVKKQEEVGTLVAQYGGKVDGWETAT